MKTNAKMVRALDAKFYASFTRVTIKLSHVKGDSTQFTTSQNQ